MSFFTKRLGLIAVVLLCNFTLNSYASTGADSVILYTPYTKITVAPGQIIDYPIDLLNKSQELINADLTISGLPAGWNYSMKSSVFTIRQLSVLPGQGKNFNLTLEVPLKVNKGSYRFRVMAGNFAVLPLTVVVSEQGTFRTEFMSEQPNMQGSTTSTFSFQASLKNRTSEKQMYALMADAPGGWTVTFKANYKNVTSVEVNANSDVDVTIDIDPPDMIEAKTYKIPVRAITTTTSASFDLEVAITGSFSMELTTPTGLLSSTITAGDQKRIELIIRNTGTAELNDIKLTSSNPVNWEVTFDPKSVVKLEPGNGTQVFATIKAAKQAIAGDYVTHIDARTPGASARTSFRMSVKTPLLWGWVGILIIVGATGTVYYLFRKYGRR